MKTIAIDFDGVIHGYSKGWQDGRIYDNPKPGAISRLMALKELGYEIVIYTTRAHDRTINGQFQKNQVLEVDEYLLQHMIPFDRIHTDAGKPFCACFIDDNAVRFKNWDQAFSDTIKHLKK